MKMDRNIQAGLITEISCQYDFSKFGIVLYAPITTDSRSDFIADLNGKLIKIQCKTSREAEDGNSFSFSTCSTNWNTKSIKTYKGQIHYFYTTNRGQGYLVPVDEAGNKQKTLRLFSNDINNPSINWADNYKIEKILKSIDNSIESFVPTITKKKNSTKEKYCIDCGTKITRNATRCKSCRDIFMSKTNCNKKIVVERDDLKDMIRAESFTSIGQMFNASDNAIRKWCDKYNLPKTKKEIDNYTDEEWENI